MKAWIEVSSEYRLGKKIAGESGLTAPATNRYINMMKHVNPDDIVLHYLIKQGAKKEHESTVIAISRAKSKMYDEPPRITVDLREITMLPVPIRLSEIKGVENKSANLRKLIRMSFLRYLSEMSMGDLLNLLKVHQENMQHLCNLKPYKDVLEK